MAKKERPPPAPVPEWVVTFCDLMSLLLCFFILLAAFSEIKQDEEYYKVVRSIHDAFGFTGESGKLGEAAFTGTSEAPDLEGLIQSIGQQLRKGETRNPSAAGPDPTSAHVAEGIKTVVGTTISFDAGSHEISSTTAAYLATEVVPKIRGLRFNIEVRGHAFGREDRAAAGDVDQMSFLRAKAVKDFLVTQGIESSRLSITAVGSSQPISTNVGNQSAMGQNRRVQIILTEVLPSDVHPDANGTSPSVQ